MTTFTKSVIAFGAVAGVFGLVAFFGYSPFHKDELVTIGSPSGTTFSSAKIAAINMAPINSATSSSILNTDASDRYVISAFAVCNNATTTYTAVSGAGLANWNLKAATTSTASLPVITNTNLVMNLNLATGTVAAGVASDYGGIIVAATSTISTTTPAGALVSPSTGNAAANAYKNVWASGSYLSFWFNATSTANCTPGVYYIGS